MKKLILITTLFISISNYLFGQWTTSGTNIYNSNTGNVGIGIATPQTQLDIAINSQIGTTANKFNTPLTLIKNGDQFGTDNPVFLIKHSGNGSNVFSGVGTDLGIIRITGFSTTIANKSINSNDNFYVFTNGTVGINTSYVPAGYQLAINGGVISTAVTIKLNSNWPDYVFKKDYTLPALSDVKSYIDQNQHLPEIPSAQQIDKDGQNLGEMNKLLLKKVEELTLYVIENERKDKEKDKLLTSLQEQINALKQHLTPVSKEAKQ